MSEEKEEKSAFKQLKPQWQKFLIEYIIDFNGTRAYKEAYPNCKRESTARKNASRLLTKADMKAALKEKAQEFINDKEMLIFRISKELKRTSIADIKEYTEYLKTGNIDILKNLDTRPISSIEITREISTSKETKKKIIENEKVKIRLWDKNRASEVLAKYVGVTENYRLVDKNDNDLFGAFLKNLGEE